MQDDPIIKMLKERNLTEAQIVFLLKVLNKIRGEMKSPDWSGPEASVKSVLDGEISQFI